MAVQWARSAIWRKRSAHPTTESIVLRLRGALPAVTLSTCSATCACSASARSRCRIGRKGPRGFARRRRQGSGRRREPRADRVRAKRRDVEGKLGGRLRSRKICRARGARPVRVHAARQRIEPRQGRFARHRSPDTATDRFLEQTRERASRCYRRGASELTTQRVPQGVSRPGREAGDRYRSRALALGVGDELAQREKELREEHARWSRRSERSSSS